MRKLIILLIITISTLGLNAQTLVEQAQKAYLDGDFETAIDLYQQEVQELKHNGEVSAQLYYNLGNAYFRANDIPEAILNYERAQLYDPGDKEIQHNIEFANTKIEDQILKADTFFLSMWFNSIQNLMSSNAWAKTSVIFFFVFIASLILFFFAKKRKYKKLGFYLGIVLFVLVIFSNIFAFAQKRKIEHRNTAIIMVGVTPVVSSPTLTSKEVFILHAGTKVDIRKTDGEWYEIQIADGSVGWVQKSKLEII